MCNEKKKFLAQINAGKKLYCMQCETKINKEYGTDYWKPCSFVEFLRNIPISRKRRFGKTSNMLTGLKEVIRQMEEEENNEK